MKDIAYTAAGMAAAFILSSLLGHISSTLILSFNLLSVVVLYAAVRKGEIYGAVTGMLCGLLQDSFSLGVFGVAGIAKTLAGYTAGSVAKKINLASFSRRYSFFALVLILELALWAFLYSSIFSSRIYTAGGLIFIQPFLTALVAVGIIPLIKRVSLFLEKRRKT
ncbi:MAG: rod shape-determining protein MreD [Candidatus Aminicenantaceae bacterium]